MGKASEWRVEAVWGHLTLPERNCALILISLSFLAGCLSSFFFARGAWLWLLAGLGLAIVICLHRMGAPVAVGLVLCVFALGVLYAQAAFDLPQPEPGSYEITATVYGGTKPRTDNRVSFVLSDLTLDGTPVTGKAYCSLHYDEAPPALFDGARVRLSGRVYWPDGPSGAPHMDFRLWMRQHGLAFGVAAYQDVTVENTPATAPAADVAYRLRERIRSRYERVMGAASRLPMALLLGDRDELGETEYQSFLTLGIAHLMSVSGMHVALLGHAFLWLLKRLRASRATAFALTVPLMAFYCWLTGFSAAANRAAAMLLLVMLCHLRSRSVNDRLTLLAGGMLVSLLINPLHAASAGFVLSFSAMLGIVLYSPALSQLLDRLWRPIRVSVPKREPGRQRMKMLQLQIKNILILSLTAQVGVLLPTAYYFHQIPLYGLAVNLFLAPLITGVLVPLYVLVLPASALPGLGDALGRAASLLTDGLLRLMALLSTLPHASIRVASPPVVLCVALGLGMVILSRRVPGSARRRIAAALLTVAVGMAGAWAQRPSELRYIQLSVGQADSALLLDGRQTVLIDTGVDASAALDYLLQENRDVDALILTHLHTDHAGGIQALLDSRVPIRRVYVPVCAERQRVDPALLEALNRLRAEGIPIIELASGDELRYNKAALRVLWPERETVRTGQDANLYALALSIRLDGFTLLQMSDIEGVYEAYAAVPADVLKAAHHGSSDSTGADFLRFVSPRCALLSVSSSSRSLPGPDTLARLEEAGVAVLRTDQCGDITLSVEDGLLSIVPYKGKEIP